MVDFNKSEYPWVILALHKQLFAVSAEYVQAMVALPEVTAVPQTPPYVRGVINLRGQVMPLIDLRARLGMNSLLDEAEDLCSLMDEREEDHKKWLHELEASVKENRKFELATDPHKCNFGKWYDNFKTDNLILSAILNKFDAPHKRIHAIANKVEGIAKSGDSVSALELIENCRQGDLSEMIRLFSEVRRVLREEEREIAVVLEYHSRPFAVTADLIYSVERLVEGSITDIPETFAGSQERKIFQAIGHSQKEDKLVLILALEEIINEKELVFMERLEDKSKAP